MSETLKWYDLRECVEGQGWTDTLEPYDRLPAKAEGMVPEAVWNLSRSSTGMCARFKTNATSIDARWHLRSEQLGEPNFSVAGFSGLDLYGDDNGTWRWIAAGHTVKNQTPECRLVDQIDGSTRQYMLYTPLRNPLNKLEIGLPADAEMSLLPPRDLKPMVFYGTSIVHGAYASHPGIVHPALLGRRLNRPSINLGFSGNARMEPELAELLAELDASVYMIDPLPNMDQSQVEERAATFLRILCNARPHVPVILVEDRPHQRYWIQPKSKAEHEAKWAALRGIYDSLRKEGFVQLSYIEGRDLFGSDGEASLDASHPSDLGFMRMADIFEPVLRSVL
jgi:hypothetical protein